MHRSISAPTNPYERMIKMCKKDIISIDVRMRDAKNGTIPVRITYNNQDGKSYGKDRRCTRGKIT